VAVAKVGRTGIDTTRWLAPIVLMLALVAAVLGIALFLFPEAVARSSGFLGKDLFLYRIAGAATCGYAVALVAAMRDRWRGLRIPIAGMAVFSTGSIVATIVALFEGETGAMVWIVLAVSAIFLALQITLLFNPPKGDETIGTGSPDVAEWILWLIGLGSVAALGTGGLALLLGGYGGHLLGGYSGTDSVIYREAGAATLGSAFGGLLALRSRRWIEMRGALAGSYAFNGLSLVAALVEIWQGRLNLLSIAVLGVSLLVTIGLALALRRGGR
jgi:hypothetical protein